MLDTYSLGQTTPIHHHWIPSAAPGWRRKEAAVGSHLHLFDSRQYRVSLNLHQWRSGTAEPCSCTAVFLPHHMSWLQSWPHCMSWSPPDLCLLHFSAVRDPLCKGKSPPAIPSSLRSLTLLLQLKMALADWRFLVWYQFLRSLTKGRINPLFSFSKYFVY